MNWLIENWQEIGTAVLALLGAFSILAKLTPTKWDDQAIGVITKWIRRLGLTKKSGE